jgi:hypothetical protein
VHTHIAAILLLVSSLVSGSALAGPVQDYIACRNGEFLVGTGIEAIRVWEPTGVPLSGPSAIVAAQVGLPCVEFGIEYRIALLEGQRSDDFGSGLDAYLNVRTKLFRKVDLTLGFSYIDFPPVAKLGMNTVGVGDVLSFNAELAYPWAVSQAHTLTPKFGVHYYTPINWHPLLQAENGYQLRWSLREDWRLHKRVGVFVEAGLLYDPHRTLIFQEGIIGKFGLGVEGSLFKYLKVSLTGNIWVQEDGKLDGPPRLEIPTPWGIPIVIDKRIPRRPVTGTGRLLFTVPF